MAEWIWERGIGEVRAALIEEGSIVEAYIERESDGVRAGAVCDALLTRVLIPGRRGIVTLKGGEEALIEPIPPCTSEGAVLRVEIVRARIPEPGRAKLAKARAAAEGAALRDGPDLIARIASSGLPARELLPHEPDALEAAGWSELIEEAQTGEIAFPGGGLRLSLTPAMTLFDIDGTLAPASLAVAGARAAACAIRRMGIGGSIGIDLPTLGGKDERQAAAAAIDSVLPQPFERTSVNGFGFLQIVRRRSAMSLPERIQGEPVLSGVLALLRRAERRVGRGALTISAAPPVITLIESRIDWVERLSRRIGAVVHLQVDAAQPISAGDVSSQIP